ncbi:MAG TPA: glycosyltransferase [Bacteroidales bacterium]|nr:glycosyltransferase [Bacteroidales bacterium]HPS17144.1 glycosyltransferase [Bacteroidales bacterium]
MPKVLRIINRFNLGGPTYNAALLSKHLAPEFETLLYSGAIDETEGDAKFIVRNLGIEPLTIPEMRRSLNPALDYQAYKKIKKIISEFKPDIVHTHASKAGALGRLAAYNLGVPVIIHTFHGHVFDNYFSRLTSKFYINIERYLAKKSTKIIALSEIQKNDLVNKFKICPAEKIEIISLGFDLDKFQENIELKRKKFRNDFQIADDEIAIAIIGRLVPIKNHELFLQSIKDISEKTKKKIRVFIVGDGESKMDILKKTKELNLSFTENKSESKNNLITFTSWIKEIDTVIAGIDIVALTSLNEGTPVSLIEAQAGNKPIVSTNVGGIENVVIPNETALLSPNNNQKAFAENILKVIGSDNLRQKLSQKGWQNVKEKFHFSRLISDTKKLYYQLLKQ